MDATLPLLLCAMPSLQQMALENYVMRKLELDWCRDCIARGWRRVVIDIQVFRARRSSNPEVRGAVPTSFGCGLIMRWNMMAGTSALSGCPYCLEVIKRWKLPFKTDEGLNELRRTYPEEPYPGFWWHMNE